MNILVTGGAGYIGSHTTRYLLSQGHEVWVYDNLVYGHVGSVPRERLIRGDLADRATLQRALDEHVIEAVVHFAAYAYVGESVQDPEKYYHNNLVNTLTLLSAMRQRGVARLVFSSTCATYGVPRQVPITEDEPQNPINPYGRAKLAVEWALADYARAYGLGYAALRYFNAAGADPQGDLGEDHEPETHLIPLVLQVALGQRKHIDIFGTDYPTPDGTCIRDYIHVNDLADAHAQALERIERGRGMAFNLGTGRGYSVRDVIRVAEEITGRSIAVRECPRREGDPPVLVASADLARRELAWRPRFEELKSIIATAWRWHESHPKGYEDRMGVPRQ